MMRSGFTFATLFFCLLGSDLYAQVGKAISRMQKGQWSAAEEIIRKNISKDSLDVESWMLYAEFYFRPDNPAYSIDSAHDLALASSRVFSRITPKQKEKLARDGIDSVIIVGLKVEIDSAAFEQAKRANTVEGYETFISKFAGASQSTLALELRNEVAFLNALKLNTAAGFFDYMGKYPKSSRSTEASDRYERLILDENTRDKKLSSYEKFLELYPRSAFRTDVEQQIFLISTASGLKPDLLTFNTSYATSSLTRRSRNILYYLVDERERAQLGSDSLAALERVNRGYWVPFFKNGLYGFMDDEGNEVVAPRYHQIDSSYLCGNIREDVLLTSEGLVARGGHRLLGSPPSAAFNMGSGFLFVTVGTCKTLIHKSGFRIGPACVSDARILADQFIALRDDHKWSLYAFNGLRLLPSDFEDVTSDERIILLSRTGKQILVKADEITAVADGHKLNDSRVFDEVRKWGGGKLLVRNGALEGVVDQDLQFFIPLDRQNLTRTTSGFVRSKDGQLSVVGASPEVEAMLFDGVKDFGTWMELKREGSILLYNIVSKKIVAPDLDSLWINNRTAFGTRRDSLFVFGGTGRLAVFEKNSPVNFIPSKDTLVYFWIQEKKNKVVFEANSGKKIFELDFEAIEAIPRGLFVVSQKNKKGTVKKGLISKQGKVVQPSEYDAIIPSSEGHLSLLKEKKFGLYDVAKNRLISCAYERNVMPYSSRYYSAFKGAYGLIGSNEEPVSEFEFDEIRYWNDSTAWVKKNFVWSIYSIRDRSIKLTRIRNFQYMSEGSEIVARVQQDNHYGIISNRRGVIIPATFSDIINVGSDEKPLYFTEKRVEEADIDVVIYYDHNGKLIRKQVYEADEYERIACDDN